MIALLLLAASATALAAWLAIALLRRAPWAARLADQPNARSLHDVPRRRVGGLGLLPPALLAAAPFAGPPLGVLLACAGALLVVSALDDVRSLPIRVRLPAHFLAAAVAVLAVDRAFPGMAPWTWMLALGAIAWSANLFNFMDGADGLAGGMAAIGFAAYAIAAADARALGLAVACAALSGAAVGFLVHNFAPARAFMGDAGSIPLGFLAAALGLLGWRMQAWPAWFPLLVFSPFAVDATYTLLRRGIRREAVWRAHRTHCYQRLVLSGWTHARLATSAYGLMALAAACALAARTAGPMLQCGTISAWAIAYVLLILALERRLAPAGGLRGPAGPR